MPYSDITLSLLDFIVRPPRSDQYGDDFLNLSKTEFGGKQCVRDDFDVLNNKGLKMKCTFYYINDKTPRLTIIYLHGNASSRTEGAEYAEKFLSLGWNLLVYDAIGCGKSEGEFITLGLNEHLDLKNIIEHLKGTNLVSKIVLYGRSMGAATVLMYASKNLDPLVAGIIIDSSFATLTEEIKSLMTQFVSVEFIIKGLFEFLKTNLKALYKFDIEELCPIKGIEKIKIPGLFIGAINDNLVPYDHMTQIVKAYGGFKNTQFFKSLENDAHNAMRPKQVVEEVYKFIDTTQ